MRTSGFRALVSAALLALSLGWHAASHALDLPGAAPATPTPPPVYTAQRLQSIYFSYPDKRLHALTFDLTRLDAVIAAIRVHAGNRPPRFATPAEAAQGRRDAIQLGVAMAEATGHEANPPELLLRAAIALSLAGNFDATAAQDLADARFETLLAKVPKNGEALFEYGVHLVNSGRAADARASLEQALATGEERARWPLALSLAGDGRMAEALAQLDRVQRAAPRWAAGLPVATTITAWRGAAASSPLALSSELSSAAMAASSP